MAAKKKGRKKARTAAQKAATARMLAANRAARGGTATRKKGRKKGSAKKGRKKGARKSSSGGLAALKKTVQGHSHFIAKQKKLNTVFRDSIRHIYASTSLTTPSSLRRLGHG